MRRLLTLSASPRRDDGAVLVIVAVFMLVAVVMAAAVVDLGALRSEKKEVATSTDAASLAAVQTIDFSSPAAQGSATPCDTVPSTDTRWGPTVEDVARHFLTANGNSVFESCEIYFSPGGTNSAYLTVAATEVVDYRFGQITPDDHGVVRTQSSARIGAAFVDGIYPIGLCARDMPGVGDFVNNNQSFPQYFDGDEEVTLDFGNSNCDASGNHDQIDFIDDHPNGNCGAPAPAEGAFCYDIHHGGYDGFIGPDAYSNAGGGGWNGQGLSAVLQDLHDRRVHIWIPAVGPCIDPCTGQKSFPVEYLVEVVITRFQAMGNGAGIDFDVYQVISYDYYADNGLPFTTVQEEVEPHICATGPDTTGCVNNPPPAPPPPPPPPPPPCDVTSVSTNPTPRVPVTSAGALVADLTVTVNVADALNCQTVTLDAISSTSTVAAPAPPAQSGNQYTFVFTSGTVFSATNNVEFRMHVYEDGEVRNSSTTIQTDAPICEVTSITPATSVVAVTSRGNPRLTTAPGSWTVVLEDDPLCGSVTAVIARGSTTRTVAVTGNGPSRTLTLPVGTQIDPGDTGSGKPWSVRVFNNANLINETAPANTATVTFS